MVINHINALIWSPDSLPFPNRIAAPDFLCEYPLTRENSRLIVRTVRSNAFSINFNGIVLTNDINTNGCMDFTTTSRTLGRGFVFWIYKP